MRGTPAGTVTGRGAEDGRTFELSSTGGGLRENRPGRSLSNRTTSGLGVTSVHFTFGGSTFDRLLFYERK